MVLITRHTPHAISTITSSANASTFLGVTLEHYYYCMPDFVDYFENVLTFLTT